ncbi:APC family permease [Phaeacidiphilus oryzae]|uniref:APC family permease n=1 Tax=Phaeacidiphilus oryzae TaxID=348818 RepID=UPI0007C81A4A|nr:APC family permease [Phaeacidiphilus oryzae]
MSDSTTRHALRRNTLSIAGSVAMCMAFMGPATSVAFNTPPAAAGAGYALPLAILLALVACLLVANTIAAFARKIPAAGFAYTFNTHGFGPAGGFLSGWLLLLSYGMVAPMLLAAIGTYTSQFLATQLHVHIAWQLMTLLFGLIVWGINALGVSDSAKVAMVFLVLEVGIMLGLALTVLGKGGDHGLSLAPFRPSHSLGGTSGLGTGMLWGVLMFIGFESVATLGEEAKTAKRTIPIALFSAVIVIGAFYVLTAYSAAIGYGPNHAKTFAADASPWTTLAQRYWGITWALMLTVIASQFANFVSGSNSFVRVLFAMGREGILPKALGRTSRRHIPHIALGAYMLFSFAFTFLMGAKFGPLGVYSFAGTVLGLGMIIIYILISLAVIRFYRREHPTEFRWIRLGVLPAATAILMLLPIWGQIHPMPAWPNNLVPYLIAAWMVIGAGYLLFLSARRPALVSAMGHVFESDTETGTEIAEQTDRGVRDTDDETPTPDRSDLQTGGTQ